MFSVFVCFAASEKVVLRCPKCSSYHVMQLAAGAEHSHAPLASSLPLDNARGGMPPDPFVFQFSLWSSFHACVRIAILGFVCSAWNAVVSSERVKLTPSSPAQALVTVLHCILGLFAVPEMQWSVQRGQAHTIIPSTLIGHCVHCILRLFCSGQFREGQAHTIIPSTGIGHCVHYILRLFAVVSSERVKLTPSSPAQAIGHCVYCILRLFAVPEVQQSVSARCKLTRSSPRRAFLAQAAARTSGPWRI